MGRKRKSKKERISHLKKKIAKPEVLEKLIEEAGKPREKNFKFGPEIIKFLVYCIEKYGDDYEAMSRDRRNYYQESPGQIRQKILKFKAMPKVYNTYLKCVKDVESELKSGDTNHN